MAKFSYTQFEKRISSRKFDKVYLFYGDEKRLIKQSEELASQEIKNKNQFNFMQVEAEQIDFGMLDVYLNTYPIGSLKKCVLIKNIDFDELNADFYSEFINIIKNMPDFAMIIISQFANGAEIKKSTKLLKLISSISPYACVVEVLLKNNVVLEKQIIHLAEKHGKRMSYSIAQEIVNRCGRDVTLIYNEVDKLCAFEKSDTISQKSVHAITTELVDYNVFSMCNALLSGNYRDMYKRLDNLFYNNESPILILSALTSNYVDIFRVKSAMKSSVDPYELAEIFDYKNKKFKIDTACKSARKMRWDQIKYSINEIIKADIQLKTSSLPQRAVIDVLLAKLIRIKEGEKFD